MKYARGVLGAYLTTDTRQLMAPTSFCHKFGGCFLAGDNRVNEHMMLASMHIIFSREHNRIARALTKLNPHWNAEIIYQETRKIIGAVLQKITYEDFLPMIIGNTLPPYQGYNPKVHPGILNSFSTAAFRFGHSLIRPTFDRLDANFNPVGDPMPLRHLFFNNTYIKKSGIDEIVLGLLSNSSEAMDTELASGILNNLYERRHSPGLNLAAINIQRSRDHGLPGYNSFRKICGLSDVKSFKDTVHEIPYRHNRRRLAELYNDNPDLADLWAVGLAEAPANGGIVGATFGCIIREQMRRLRDGDRYFYQNHGVFSHRQLHEIKKVTLSKVMCNNLETIVSIQRNAFVSGRRSHRRTECSNIPGIDLTAWRGEQVEKNLIFITCMLKVREILAGISSDILLPNIVSSPEHR
jgi:peroxidase